MARSDADHLEKLKLFRDELVDALDTGDAQVVTIRGRSVTRKYAEERLQSMEELISMAEQKVSDRGTSRIALGTLNPASISREACAPGLVRPTAFTKQPGAYWLYTGSRLPSRGSSPILLVVTTPTWGM